MPVALEDPSQNGNGGFLRSEAQGGGGLLAREKADPVSRLPTERLPPKLGHQGCPPSGPFFSSLENCHRSVEGISYHLAELWCLDQAAGEDDFCPRVALLVQRLAAQFEIEDGGK